MHYRLMASVAGWATVSLDLWCRLFAVFGSSAEPIRMSETESYMPTDIFSVLYVVDIVYVKISNEKEIKQYMEAF